LTARLGCGIIKPDSLSGKGGSIMYTLDSFLTDTHRIAHIPQHVRVFSGRSTIGRFDGSVTGVERFFCPPYAAADLSFSIRMDIVSHNLQMTDDARTGHGIPAQMKLQKELWHPSYLYRKGVAHEYLGGGKEVSMAIESWLVPSALDDSFFLKLRLRNASDQAVQMVLSPSWRCCRFGHSHGKEWGWNIPSVGQEEAKKVGDGLYQGDYAWMSLYWSSEEGRSERGHLSLEAGEEREIILKVLFSEQPEADGVGDLPAQVDRSLAIREEKWNAFWESAPHLNSAHAALDKAYRYSLFNLFMMKWESPHFAVNPFYSEAGINGGALCAYVWGDGYTSKILPLLEKENCRSMITAYLGMGLDKHYAFDPVNGVGNGPRYNYNLYAITCFIRDYVACTGDEEFLIYPVDGVPLYRRLVQVAGEMEGLLGSHGALLDYGGHHGMLEMRGSGYEHMVPSPNGERVVIYRYLASLLEKFGHAEESVDFLKRAEEVRCELTGRLWDEETGWLKCLYPDGHTELVYSVQIFDLLGQGILSPEQEEKILTHLNEQEFLSEYGVNSVSKQDEWHFDLGDVDRSGAGAYLGDPLALIETLFALRRPEMAWDVARRMLWLPEKYPYWPQSLWASKTDYSHWEQPINISALVFAQAVVFGMFGLKIVDGEAKFDPQIPEAVGQAHLTNVRVNGRIYEC